MKKYLQLTSFENASILRKMTILYFLMSIVPMCLLYYLYMQLRDFGKITITEDNLSLTLFLVVLGVGIGYVAMRSMLVRIIDLSQSNKRQLESILGPEQFRSLSSSSRNEIAVLTQSFNEITTRLEENVRNLELAKRTLHTVLSKVGEGISSMDNIDSFLNLIIETVTTGLHSKYGALLLFSPDEKKLMLNYVFGKKVDRRQVRLDVDGVFQQALDRKGPVIVDSSSRAGDIPKFFDAPLMCSPLLLHDAPLGVIVVWGRMSDEMYAEEEENLLHNLSVQTAIAIENSRLNEDAEKTYFETISALALAVEAKDPYSRGHLERVSKLVVKIAQEVGFSQEDVNTLRDAAKLHDIGKIGVSDKILKKPSELTTREKDIMNRHCEIGEGIIRPIRSLRNLCDIIRHHHEKLDGTGYPDGLKGDQISSSVRILTVADIYDALTSDRAYRASYPKEKAIDVMRQMKDSIDQKIVDVLIKVVA